MNIHALTPKETGAAVGVGIVIQVSLERQASIVYDGWIDCQPVHANQ